MSNGVSNLPHTGRRSPLPGAARATMPKSLLRTAEGAARKGRESDEYDGLRRRGSPGPGTPGAGPSADMGPQAGPRAAGAVPGAAPGGGRKRITDREKRNLRMGLLFISPWMIGVTVFVVYPLA